MKKKQNPFSGNKGEYEICIVCGRETDVKVSTPVQLRVGYIIGCGQMCRQCYEEQRLKKSPGNTKK